MCKAVDGGIISVTNWLHHAVVHTYVCVYAGQALPNQPTNPAFSFTGLVRARIFFSSSSSSFWFAPLSEWALSSSPNSPTTLHIGSALFFFLYICLIKLSSSSSRIMYSMWCKRAFEICRILKWTLEYRQEFVFVKIKRILFSDWNITESFTLSSSCNCL